MNDDEQSIPGHAQNVYASHLRASLLEKAGIYSEHSSLS